MCDGSLHREGKILTLHSQSFTEGENQWISSVINKKRGLSSRCMPHKEKYYVVQFPGRDAPLLRQMLSPHLISTMMYKLPRPKGTGGNVTSRKSKGGGKVGKEAQLKT